MSSASSEKAISDALQYGKALLKFISPNNVGLTGSHECGYYLPKAAWKMYTPHPPEKGENQEHFADILWPDGRITNSCVKWYGVGTRSEYRLTRFGRDFPWLTSDNIGDLLVLIPTGEKSFIAHVLKLEEDIEEIQAALGVEITDTWGIYDRYAPPEEISEDDCILSYIKAFAASLSDFPDTNVFSSQAVEVLTECDSDFVRLEIDKKILDLVDVEYRLFKIVERKLCQDQISRLFESVDDFLKTAATIMNRRKARAGRSLENHVEYVLSNEGIPFDIRPDIDGKPDIVIPGKEAYDDPDYPIEKLFMLGVKTTCKDRWRQVLNEARRIDQKHLLTLQHGISQNQLDEMHTANLQLIVPKSLHKEYPSEGKMTLLSVEDFVESVRVRLG